MKKQLGEVLLVTILTAAIGCIAVAWLEYAGVPLPLPKQEASK